MAASSLHDSLKSLGAVPFTSVPTSEPELKPFLQSQFSAARYILESIPHPPLPNQSKGSSNGTRSRATSSTSSLSAISQSSARSSTPTPEHEQLQKDWGKPLKLSEKENPLGISVYKLQAKDGKGAWFARRSVHEGLSFERWKEGLVQEFPSSLAGEGGPGAGKVRGIGAEEKKEVGRVENVGRAEVYHLSAQFPGPSAPRDFVTLLLTSDCVLSGDERGEDGEASSRHYMVVSKPCEHPDYPPGKDGLVRGNYESIEFIREVKKERKIKKAASTTDLPDELQEPKETAISETGSDNAETTGRARGKTISFADTKGSEAGSKAVDSEEAVTNDSDEEVPNPVEWIMISRSDPGGSVPRFLVERGTPAGIVTDAGKFLGWACSREDSSAQESSIEDSEETPKPGRSEGEPEQVSDTPGVETTSAPSLLSTAANAAYSAAETYVPKLTNGLLSATNATLPDLSDASIVSPSRSRSSSLSSHNSFASAEEDFSDVASLPSTGSNRQLSPQEKELLRLAGRKSELAEKLRKTKETGINDKDNPTEKELSRIKKAQEKYDREITKAEERYAKATKQIEDRRRREEAKEEERKERDVKREVERRQKAERKEREQKERAEKKELETRLKSELEKVRKEADALRADKEGLNESVRKLQAENTKLVTMIGKLEGGQRLLRELKGGTGTGSQESGEGNGSEEVSESRGDQ